MQTIEIKNLSFIYSKKTPYEKLALDNISLSIKEGEFVGIIGHTGSGKSTFIQHINGLIKPQDGSVKVFDIDLTVKKPKPDLRKLRQTVGMVFQYPEYQLFADTVEKDVAYGPKNLKLADEVVAKRVKEAIELVGLNYELIKDRSPFDLSGGQKRRVAIAGVLAMRPKVLILDEPTAGLDPQGKEEILNLITKIKESYCSTIVVISHDIDEITQYAQRLVVFSDAKVKFDIPMTELFKHEAELLEIGLEIPTVIILKNMLKNQGIELDDEIITLQDFNRAILKVYNSKQKTAFNDVNTENKVNNIETVASVMQSDGNSLDADESEVGK